MNEGSAASNVTTLPQNELMRARIAFAAAQRDRLAAERDRKALSEAIKAKKDKMIHLLEVHSDMLAYDKNDKAIVMSLNHKERPIINKTALASMLGVAARTLTTSKIAELVEQGKLTSEQIRGFEDHKLAISLKQKRATKAQVQQLSFEL